MTASRVTDFLTMKNDHAFGRLPQIALILTSLLLVLGVNRWTLHGAMFFFADEFGVLGRTYWKSYLDAFNLLPIIIYSDRPVGFLFNRILYDVVGFDYLKQIVVLLCVHVVNFGLVLLLARRLLRSFLFALITATLFAANSSTITAVWYLGAIFDVLCTGLLLASTLTYLRGGAWQIVVSPVLFFLALRSKEFAVAFPSMLILLEWQAHSFKLNVRTLLRVVRPVTPHLLVLVIVLAAYAAHLPDYFATIRSEPDNPYLVSWAPGSMLNALNYYVAVVFYGDGLTPASTSPGYLLILAALLVFAVAARRFYVFFGVFGFVALLLAVLMLPRQSSPAYVYGPSAFLFLALTDVLKYGVGTIGGSRLRMPGRTSHLAVYASIVAALLALANTPYVGARVDNLREARQLMFVDAQPVLTDELRFGHGAHYYVSGLRPYLNIFSNGPCNFMQIYYRDQNIRCFVEMPTDQLENLYAADTAERYFFDYADGALRLRASAAALR